MDTDYLHESNLHYDVLREIGNIGSGNATTALSQLLGAKRLDLNVPTAEMLFFKDLAEVFGGAETLAAGILFSLSGEIEGSIMFMLEVDAAHHLVNGLMGSQPLAEDSEFSEMELSALKEIGNIIAGAYLSSISELTNLMILSSVPHLAVDMAGAILSVPAIEFGKLGDKALLIESRFGQDGEDISGYFILIPTMESYGRIMNSLGL